MSGHGPYLARFRTRLVDRRNGYFAQERRYIEVMALIALGRLGEAHAQAAAYLHDYPNAAYRRKVELEVLRQPQH